MSSEHQERRLKVMIVEDDQGWAETLIVLIDWEALGYEITNVVRNGQEAVDLLRTVDVDLIISDIHMPVLGGLQLLEHIKTEHLSDACVVVMSTSEDFASALCAWHYECMDYLVKPFTRERLQDVLARVQDKVDREKRRLRDDARMKEAYLKQNIAALLQNRYAPEEEAILRKQLQLTTDIRYIHISLDNIAQLEELSDDECEAMTLQMYQNVRTFLGDNQAHCVKDLLGFQNEYEIGLIYSEGLAKKRHSSTDEYLEALWNAAQCDIALPVVVLVGKPVEELKQITKSYSSACVLRSFRGFHDEKHLYYYENEVQVTQTGIVILKETLDKLIAAVERNDRKQIYGSVNEFYLEMERQELIGESETININYLMFQFIHLAVKQDESVNQQEIMRRIEENVFDSGIARNTISYLRKFSCEYAQYLVSLRKNVSTGILQEVEREIKEHYDQNLTLRELGKKYYINSSYLGQLFRKKFGSSFKDYLNDYRINEAAVKLISTDHKISQVAEEVGYKDMDYFVSRFIALKGCTPAKYRKR
ncbi:MAG: response regulator [Lachnospiraceae bacterium]|jgi:two-component system response regulator YesN|nr:response regulator [Lachnospiraceae bacterium]